MRCFICKRGSDERDIYEGLYETTMIRVCKPCAQEDGIPLIKRPTEDQIKKSKEVKGVRERMERLSGLRKRTSISEDQIAVQGHVAKLRALPKKQHHEDALDDYYWTLNIARRRKKLSLSQLAEKVGTTPQIIDSIERGTLPEKFQELFLRLEDSLDISLLKNRKAHITFTRSNRDIEKEILTAVKNKIGEREEVVQKEKQEKIEKIQDGRVDFSKREDLQEVTLNDLISMKRDRDKKIREKEKREARDALIGEDFDLELDEEL